MGTDVNKKHIKDVIAFEEICLGFGSKLSYDHI